MFVFNSNFYFEVVSNYGEIWHLLVCELQKNQSADFLVQLVYFFWTCYNNRFAKNCFTIFLRVKICWYSLYMLFWCCSTHTGLPSSNWGRLLAQKLLCDLMKSTWSKNEDHLVLG